MLLFALLQLASAANVEVDVGAGRRPVSDGIYGVSFGTEQQVRRMGATVRHFGGNGYSRYDWRSRTTNEGGDGLWFRNVVLDGGLDEFLAVSAAAPTRSLVELPMLGCVAKPAASNAAPRTCGCSVAKYGAQQSVAPDDPDCGDCRLLDGGWLGGVESGDTSQAIDAGYLRAYVDRLLDAGVSAFILGNQPALWSATHFDVHPAPSSYAEIRDRFVEAAAVVKAASPRAKTLGPSEWGWLNYFDSAALDRPDSGVDFVLYYLQQARLVEQATGTRPLDYLDLHVYPMAQNPDVELIFRGDVTPAASGLRLRSTRILWDPQYLVESWESCCYDTVLRIIPRMHDWVDAGYPGTGVSISAYTWGALGDISGALALTDVLGVFGREGVDLAILEALPAEGAIGEDAFRLFRDYDDAGSRFGPLSVRGASDEVELSSYASVRGDRVVLVLINKRSGQSETVDVSLVGVPRVGTYRAFGFNAAQRLGATGAGMFVDGQLTRVLAPWSAEVVELAPLGWDGGVVVVDAGVDAGAPDAGPRDAGAPDAGGLDAGGADAGTADAGGATDAGAADAGADAGTRDAGAADAGADAGAPDAGRPDGGSADAGTAIDAGMMSDGGGQGGCGCGTRGAPWFALALLAALRRRRLVAKHRGA